MIPLGALMLFAFFNTPDSLSTDYPFIWNVTSRVSVTCDSAASMFYYYYSFVNDSANRGGIEAFKIVIWRNASTTTEFDTTGLRFTTKFAKSEFQTDYPRLRPWIVPVGFPQLPSGWDGELFGNYPYAAITTIYEPLKPGKAVSGITLMSKGLPGVREVIVEPRFDEDLYYPMEEGAPAGEEDSLHAITLKVDSIRQAVIYHGLTIGPWAPPAKFEPLIFLDTLISFVHESQALGLIPSKQEADRFISIFSLAKSDIENADIEGADSRIDSILVDLRDARTSRLSTEAYALIRYNAEYLKRMLSTQARH
jgi:hypothetical protein